jgi:hypothetical protein
LAFWHLYSVQNQLFCDVLKKGLPHSEVRSRLLALHPTAVETLSTFLLPGSSAGAGQVNPYPAVLTLYAANVVHFYGVNVPDNLDSIPPLGLGFDVLDQLVVISSDTYNDKLNYQITECPWSVQDSLDTLFK